MLARAVQRAGSKVKGCTGDVRSRADVRGRRAAFLAKLYTFALGMHLYRPA